MAQAAKSTRMPRQAGAAKATDSTIANLPGRTDTATVRAARPVALKKGENYTGQYLYDRFVNDKAANKEDLTKMEIVTNMVEVLEANDYEAVIANMVGFAKRDLDAAIAAAKAANSYDSENPTWPIREAKSRLNTARAHQTVMRTAFGLLKFCAEELSKKLNGAPLPYRMVREVGPKMLQDKGIDWKGNKLPAPGDREARKEQETETAAMLAIQKEMPRKDGESRAEYFARIDSATEQKMRELREAEAVKNRAALADKVRALCGADLPDILEILMTPTKPEVKAADVVPAAKADKNLH